jgi:hypothetical protein
MPITVREIAQLTGHAGSKPFIERLHYWTREGLLKPVGERSPGRGKRVTYPDTAARDAAILNTMMDGGVPVEGQKLAMGMVRQDRHLRQLHPSKMPKPFFLVIVTFEGGYGHPYFHPPLGSAPSNPLDFKIPQFAKRVAIFDLTEAIGGTHEQHS